ncbi:fumarylacetoacetase [Rhabdobacter roseus]|uniref:fumarylacetoacetase n=1 Tax=Rhabdobacter roseus TaxID=1655419 RepID=A0A840TNN3_9BACT|nr:fumarylacetoacetase [Rhabdobacter roseus]MBB5285321.1 fumarylacetoacetase [Rhabdobacter roseus]
MTQATSWLAIPADSDFSFQNLPYGIFSTAASEEKRVGVAIGTWIIDLAEAARLGLFHDWEARYAEAKLVFRQITLNAFIALGAAAHQALRQRLRQLLTEPEAGLRAGAEEVLVEQAAATLHLPVQIGDYTDFYSSQEHATNVGKLFRPDNPLLPNWKYLPVAYHGRASSIVVSGTPIRRPWGQVLSGEATVPVFEPTQALDFELELGFIIGKESRLGVPVPAAEAENYIFGLVLFNDWSARDIQRWEYQPLGPFLSKNFASSISPWVVPLAALEPFRVPGPVQDPAPLPYLQTTGALNFDLQLTVEIITSQSTPAVVTRTNARYLYWNIRQQVAHHTVTGCNLRVGDLLATGTISGGEGPDAHGCLLELTEGGRKPLQLPTGAARTYLLDGDEVVMRGWARTENSRVGFGEVRGKIVPSAYENP